MHGFRSRRTLRLGVVLAGLTALALTAPSAPAQVARAPRSDAPAAPPAPAVRAPAPRAARADSVSDDETVVLFPTYGWLDEAGRRWHLPVHGWIYEEEAEGSPSRAALLASLARSLELPAGETDETFRRRARPFLADNERGKVLAVRVGEWLVTSEPSEPNGHFEAELELPADVLRAGLGTLRPDGLRVPVEVVAADGRRFTGSVQLAAPDGVSLVSDIDDTIKVSAVASRRELLRNTFLRPLQAVPGIAEVYAGMAADGVLFHYVSSSPWQLYEPLREFLDHEGFPAGSMHLKHFRWKDSSFFDLFAAPAEHKLGAILLLFEQCPRRRFILVGDSGESDPEIYGQVHRSHGERVLHIVIRNVSGDVPDPERYAAALGHVPRHKWTVVEPDGHVPHVRFESWLPERDGG